MAKAVKKKPKKEASRMSTEVTSDRGRRRKKPQHRGVDAFSENVRKVLERRGWSVNWFSKQVGISQPHLCELLNYHYDCRFGTALRIAEALDVPIERLLDRTAENVANLK